jgi:hypothetical protein
MDKQLRLAALTLLSSMIVAGCGGGDSSPAAAPAPSPSPAPAPAPAPAPSTATAAATATAEQNPMCVAVQPFYWEIGDQTGVLASGGVGSGAPARTDPISIASASKWLYAGYVIQKLGGAANLDKDLDVPYLNFTSGYSQFGSDPNGGSCSQTGTVQDCVDANNSAQDPTTIGVFAYNSGHMEVHAASARIGLAQDNDLSLGTDVLGTVTGNAESTSNIYTQPLLAGGVLTSAASYANYLVAVLSGSFGMHDVLVDDAQPLGTAMYKVATTGTGTVSPISAATNADGKNEYWNYSLGHWVEDDPTYGDHALSSAGADGFYPWIDKTLTYYGILARQAPQNAEEYEGFQSAQCGRLIRQAWVTGVTVTASVPTPSAE